MLHTPLAFQMHNVHEPHSSSKNFMKAMGVSLYASHEAGRVAVTLGELKLDGKDLLKDSPTVPVSLSSLSVSDH